MQFTPIKIKIMEKLLVLLLSIIMPESIILGIIKGIRKLERKVVLERK
jgi:hypothetical protein